MPAKRTWIFLLIATILYFLATQTQVGWIYVITAGIVGLLAVAFLYGRKRLNTIVIQRLIKNASLAESSAKAADELTSQTHNNLAVQGEAEGLADLVLPAFHEDDPVEVTLHVQNSDLRPVFLISGQEICPFAPPMDQHQSLFIPSLFKNQPLKLTYQTLCDRRGYYVFSDILVQSAGLFGFFHTRRRLKVPSDILIYPQYHPLKRLETLEKRQIGQRETVKVGVGTQVIGTREFRPGDSLRQVHWRSTARRGEVVVKEFMDEDQLTLTVVLDLQAGHQVNNGKYIPFESAIRIAASLGYYATHKHIPFYLVGVDKRGRSPQTPLSWPAILTYLAKIKNDGALPFPQLLESIPPAPFLIVLIHHPTAEVVKTLAKISRKHTQTLVIFVTPDGGLPLDIRINSTPHLTIKPVAAPQWQVGVEAL